jgi:hypothetical protein
VRDASHFLAVLFLFAALSGPAVALADTGDNDTADTAGDGIGGVNIGERKEEAIDDRLSCAAGGTEGLLLVGVVGLAAGAVSTRRRPMGDDPA